MTDRQVNYSSRLSRSQTSLLGSSSPSGDQGMMPQKDQQKHRLLNNARPGGKSSYLGRVWFAKRQFSHL